MITTHPALDESQLAAVRSLVEQATLADQVPPLNESALLGLDGQGSTEREHWTLTSGDELAGYAQLDTGDGSVQLVVAPAHRRRGHGRALAEAIKASGGARTWWAFGDLPGAPELARELDLKVVRALLIMTLDLAHHQAGAPQIPDGITIDHFRPDDLPRLVEVNAAAFATHPEQGALTSADFEARMAADWFDPAGLLVARDASGQLVGYHWTKLTRNPNRTLGEVYVLGVDPSQAGRGTGRALLELGIIHMRSQGASLVDLYVEAANQRVVAMYRMAGFEVTHSDVAYGSVEEE